jgi:2'-hydroxyisoflavone reductase
MTTTRRSFLRVTAAAGAYAGVAGGRSLAQAGKAQRTLLMLGGTGFLGPEVVDGALRRGWKVTLFNRGKTNPGLFPDLEKLQGDRHGDLASLRGRTWDAVVDTSGYLPADVRDSARLLKDAKQYVFVSSISVYADNSKPGMTESAAVLKLPAGKDPYALERKDVGQYYGELKALCEQEAEKALPGRALIVRPGLIVGPTDPTDRFTYWPVRVARGGEVLAPGDPGDPVQIIDVRDLGEWIAALVDGGGAGVYHATGPKEPLGIGALLDACRKASGSDARFTWADAAFLEEQKVQPWSDMPVWVPPAGEMAGFARVDCSKAIAKGLTFRPVVDTCRDTLAWWNKQPAERTGKLRAGLAPEREKEVLAALHARAAGGQDAAPQGAAGGNDAAPQGAAGGNDAPPPGAAR